MAVVSGICALVLSELGDAREILDVGCGNGKIDVCIAKTGRRVTGVDVSHEGFALAHKSARNAAVREHVYCIKADAAKLTSILDEKFDAALFVFTLHHMQEPDVGLAEARKVLKRNGRLVVVEYLKVKRKSKCQKFTREELRDMIARSDFTVTQFKIEKKNIVIISATKGWAREIADVRHKQFLVQNVQ